MFLKAIIPLYLKYDIFLKFLVLVALIQKWGAIY
jgi:hypothetical protein